MKNPRLKDITRKMKDRDISAVIIPLTDPHMSEYIGDQWKFLEWLSGFTGSAGTLVVTMDYAGLWTDSRYFIQAEQELNGTGIALHRYIKKSDHYAHWIKEHIDSDSSIGIDGRMFSISQVSNLKNMLSLRTMFISWTSGQLIIVGEKHVLKLHRKKSSYLMIAMLALLEKIRSYNSERKFRSNLPTGV